MSSKNLSSIATDVINTYGITATNIINTYRFGGERVVGFFDERFAQAVNRGASALRVELRSNLISSQQRLSGYYVRGVHFGTERAQNAVGMAVDLATRSVGIVSTNAARIGGRREPERSGCAQQRRDAGGPDRRADCRAHRGRQQRPGQARRRQAGAGQGHRHAQAERDQAQGRRDAQARHQDRHPAGEPAIADAATDTSNTARRVARRAKTATRQVNDTVADVAGKTSNAARLWRARARRSPAPPDGRLTGAWGATTSTQAGPPGEAGGIEQARRVRPAWAAADDPAQALVDVASPNPAVPGPGTCPGGASLIAAREASGMGLRGERMR